jgi:hypothetical protein
MQNLPIIIFNGLSQLGYVDGSAGSATDVLHSKKGGLKNPGIKPGIYAGGNYTFTSYNSSIHVH